MLGSPAEILNCKIISAIVNPWESSVSIEVPCGNFRFRVLANPLRKSPSKKPSLPAAPMNSIEP